MIRLDGGGLIRVTLTVSDAAHEVNVRADFAAVLDLAEMTDLAGLGSWSMS